MIRDIKIGMVVSVQWFGATKKGTVEFRDGQYIYVRLADIGLIEVYPNEMEKAE